MAKVHRKYKHSWWRRSQREITERDLQAMYNFCREGISLETLAEHFGCDISRVTEAITTRPWLKSRKGLNDLGQSSKGHVWWESDHSDPLELVKLYYPQHVPLYYVEKESSESSAKEKRSTPVIDAEAYLDKAFGPGYVTPENIETVQSVLDGIVEQLEEHEVEYDGSLVLSLLDQRLTSSV